MRIEKWFKNYQLIKITACILYIQTSGLNCLVTLLDSNITPTSPCDEGTELMFLKPLH